MKHVTHATGITAGPELTAELRRLANLFLVCSITLALFLLRMVAEALAVTFVPRPAALAWGVALLAGWAASLVLGVWTTSRARRWGWMVLCAIPFTSVPAGVAYAWIRRREVEDEVLVDAHGVHGWSGRGPR